MTEPPQDLRDRLRALGYLNAPVDRFVLGGAEDRRSTARLAVSSSVRIGLVAGLLLGPAAAVGLASKLPELITGVTDAIVVAGYLGVMFGVSAAAAALVATTLALWLTRGTAASVRFSARARAMAAGAGVLVAVATLAYLTLWWRAAVTTSASPSVWFSMAVLGIAVSISLVLGHAVTVAALAIAARANASSALGPGIPFSSWRATVPLAIAAFAGAAVLLFTTASGGAEAAPSPALTVVPTGQRVLVIAVDGVDLSLIGRLRQATPGALPAMGRFLDAATAPLPAALDRDPARVWTTVATGQPPERHGISALESRQLAGVEGRVQPTSRLGGLIAGATDLVRLTHPAIASGTERRIPAFWEVAARSGLRTAAINWWATWPAGERGEDTDIVLTDRALLRLEQGGALDAEIAPASLYAELERSWPARRERFTARARAASGEGLPHDVAAIVRRSAELDAAIADLAGDPALSQCDLEVLYLPGLDIAQHGLLASGVGGAASTASVRVQALEGYYQFLDGLIQDLVDDGRTIVFVAQPGRVDAPGNGLLAIAGTPSVTGARAEAALTSIAGTVLYLLGVPVAEDLASPVPTALLTRQFLDAHPERFVTTYGPRRMGPRMTTGKPLDREMIERMRSLGYVR